VIMAFYHSEEATVDPRTLTVTFNEHINNRDVDALARLMTDDHTFIDSAAHEIRGRSKWMCV